MDESVVTDRLARRHRQIGAAERDVTPTGPQFLYGYPHVERTSTGVHDSLLASTLYLDDGLREALFVAVDVIWLSKWQVPPHELTSRLPRAYLLRTS